MIVPVKISIEIGSFHLNYNINLDINQDNKEIIDIVPNPNWKEENEN